MKNVVIVESPAKSKTIKGFLGKDYEVVATLGHIKDLPKKELGVDVEKDFEPKYVVSKGRNKTIKALKTSIGAATGKILLATDPDREGEAIAWQVGELAGAKKTKNIQRIVFHEITKSAILDAIKSPRDVDMNLVSAQKTRRILDRLVGYELSGLLWKKIRYGLSAGRVQSVALRFVVEREKEIKDFVPEKFFLLRGTINSIEVWLVNDKGKQIKLSPDKLKEFEKLVKGKSVSGTVQSITNKSSKVSPFPPYTTALMQRDANNALGFSASRTMRAAQSLYQGVTIKGKGSVGLITYMRTDSYNLSSKAIDEMRKVITSDYGKDLLDEKIRVFSRKSKVAQEAHEAIRPAHFDMNPEKVKDSLPSDEYKLYKLIWNRAIATQMKPMEVQKSELIVKTEGDHLFGSTASKVQFDGFASVIPSIKKMYEMKVEFFDKIGKLKENKKVTVEDLNLSENETKPKARYTEATLIKKLERLGVGRPSTYASIIQTIVDRGYVIKEAKKLLPTDNGILVSDFLVKYFNNIVDYKFTAKMEDDLDSIANGEKERVPLLRDFYGPFHKKIDEGMEKIDKKDVVVIEKSDEKCPVCGEAMVVKIGRNGKFLSCSKFPDCKGIKAIGNELDTEKYVVIEKCDKCGEPMVIKYGRFGKFWACSAYPKCKNAKPLMLIEKCPQCDGNLVERKGKWGRSFTGCSNYPKCDYIKK